MRRIWKWKLERTDVQTLDLPKGAEILTVQVQDDIPQLWALIDDSVTETEQRHIGMYGTDHPIYYDPGRYISTVQFYSGKLVFHIFEERL